MSLFRRYKLTVSAVTLITTMVLAIGVPTLIKPNSSDFILGQVKSVAKSTIDHGATYRKLSISVGKGVTKDIWLCLRNCPTGLITAFRADDILVGTKILIHGKQLRSGKFAALNIESAATSATVKGSILRVNSERKYLSGKRTQSFILRESLYGGQLRNKTVTFCKANCGSNPLALISGSGSLARGRYALVSGTTISEGNFYANQITLSNKPISATPSPSPTPTPLPIVDTSPPSTPGTPTLAGHGPTGITITWTASNDDVGVVGYKIYRSGIDTPIGTTTGTSFSDTHLTPNTSYTYYVVAYDATNKISGHSLTFTVSTDPPPPPGITTVLGSELHQSIDGFGAAFPGAATWIRYRSGYSNTYNVRDYALELLFSPVNGAGLSIARFEILADNHDNKYPLVASIDNIEPSEGNWYWDGDRDQVWLMQQLQSSFGVKFLSTVWSPPPWMKGNNDYRGSIGDATLRLDKYQAYADYLSRYVREYKTRFGVDIYAISIANEPNFPAWYQGALWDGPTMVNFLKTNLKPTFQRDGVTALIVAPENSRWDDTGRISEILNDPDAANSLDVLGNHGYSGETADATSAVTAAKIAGKKVWMTEVSDQASQDASMTDGLRWAKYIHHHMVDAESNAFIWWWAANLGHGDTGFGDGLLHIPPGTSTPGAIFASKRLWAIGNFSRFIRPGFVHIGSSESSNPNVLSSAYKDPGSGQLVIVAINDQEFPQEMVYNLTGISGVNSITPYVTSDTQSLEREASISVSPEGSFTATLAPKSVTSFVRNASLPTAPTKSSYLSDLEWIDASSHTRIIPMRDASTPGRWGDSVSPLDSDHPQYTKGFGITPGNTLTFNLDGQCSTFTATVEMSAGCPGVVDFQLEKDGQIQQLQQAEGSSSHGPFTVSADVTGVKILRLKAAPGAGFLDWCPYYIIGANWLNPRVTCGTGGAFASITEPLSGNEFQSGATVTVKVAADPSSGSTSISKVELFDGATLVGTATGSSPYVFNISNLVSGTHQLKAKVTESNNQTTDSAIVSIVGGVNSPPMVGITSPRHEYQVTYTAPATIDLTAQAGDSDGTVTSVEFFNGNTSLGYGTATGNAERPWGVMLNALPAGTYNFSARATDNNGAQSRSGITTIVVQ